MMGTIMSNTHKRRMDRRSTVYSSFTNLRFSLIIVNRDGYADYGKLSITQTYSFII